MHSKWLSPFVFTKKSKYKSFLKFDDNHEHNEIHLYSPWDERQKPQLLFKIKKMLRLEGVSQILLSEISTRDLNISDEQINRFQKQLSSDTETHLVVSNFESVHLYRVREIFKQKNDILIKVDDVFVLSAHEEVDSLEVEKTLKSFIDGEDKEEVFSNIQLPLERMSSDSNLEFKWSQRERNVTYEYFIESKELQENIYQSGWNLLTKSAQHELTRSGLAYHQSLFLSHDQKWKKLESSFLSFKLAVYIELNDLYILNLCSAINSSEPLNQAWTKFKDLNPHKVFVKNIDMLLSGEVEIISDFDNFSNYVDEIKSFLFFMKQYFSKNLVNKESLFIESFISNHDQLVDPYRLSEIRKLLYTYNQVEGWITKVSQVSSSESSPMLGGTQRECNLKLSGLVKGISSLDLEQNILLKLLREKSSVHIPKQTLEGQVKSLFNIDLKKVA